MRAWSTGLIGLLSPLLRAGLWSWGTYHLTQRGLSGPAQRPWERDHQSALCTAWISHFEWNLCMLMSDQNLLNALCGFIMQQVRYTLLSEGMCVRSNPNSKVHGASMGPSGADRTQVGPMLAPWTLLSGNPCGLSMVVLPVAIRRRVFRKKWLLDFTIKIMKNWYTVYFKTVKLK